MSIFEVDLPDGLLLAVSQDQPLRGRASTRSSPTHSYRSTPTELYPVTRIKPNTPSSGRASPFTGKAQTIAGPGNQPVSQRYQLLLKNGDADTKISYSFAQCAELPSATLNVDHLNNRLTSRGFSEEPEDVFEQSFFEPRPYERVPTSLSQIIAVPPGSIRDSIGIGGFGGHRDTFAILGIRHCLSQSDIDLPASFSPFEPGWPRTGNCIPTEILEQIYDQLLPWDFNAARRTCRAWMVASLDTRLLTSMLKRGGWWTAALADQATMDEDFEQNLSSLEWLLSKRLATECALSPGWSRNGMTSRSPVDQVDQYDSLATQRFLDRALVTLDQEMDFSAITEDVFGGPMRLTPSPCGRYLLVFKDSMIHVFSLGDDMFVASDTSPRYPQSVKSIRCPRQVLAVSMDSTSGARSIAAILEDRMGFLCSLDHDPRDTTQFMMPKIRIPTWVKSTPRQSSLLEDQVEIELPLPLASLIDMSSSPPNPWALEELPTSIPSDIYRNLPSPSHDPTIFYDLCSVDHSPLSVAIAPQQSCVGFGCSTGIELRWRDPISSQGHTRWISSDTSCDYLYFLPPRLADTSNQTRLVSSSACLDERSVLLERLAPAEAEEEQNAMVWESTSAPCSYDQCPSTKPGLYKAKPCSDGWHILFSDEENGNVYLGVDSHDSEARNGERFSKVAIFLRADVPNTKATCYTVATELSWGPRVVVGYSDGGIYLYSVPADMFRAGRGSNQWDWLETWDALATVDGGAGGYAVWPVVMNGIRVGHVDGLADVAIRGKSGGVRVWAFSSRGKGYRWGLGGIQEGKTRKWRVVKDHSGLRIEDEDEVDEDGDWRMRDAPPLSERVYSSFDGHASPRRENSDVPMRNDIEDDDEGYGSGEDIPYDLETRIRTHKRHCNTPLPISDDLSYEDGMALVPIGLHIPVRDASVDDQEAIVKSTNKSLNDTPFRGSGVEMKAASGEYATNINDPLQPHSSPYPRKRRRLLSSTAPTPSILQDPSLSFDIDQRTVSRLTNPLALNVPSLKRNWSETEGEDWVPDYLGMEEGWDELGKEDVGMDLWAMAGEIGDDDIL